MNFGGKKKTVALPWRQNFRDEKLLPDLKIVRTHFMFNAVAIGFLSVTAGLFTYQEYSLSVRGDELKGIQSEIRAESATDKKILAGNAAFTKELNRLSEGVRFAAVPVRPELFFASLAKVQVPNGVYGSMAFSRMETTDKPGDVTYLVALDGTMAPSAEASAPAEIGRFVSLLRGLPSWGGSGHNVELVSSSPAEDLNIFTYSIKLSWTADKGAASK
jgi:hypothetical protein